METLDPVESDVAEDRATDRMSADSPVDVGGAVGAGRMAPTAFRCRRQMDIERESGSHTVACFELSANSLVYAVAPTAPPRPRDACRQGRLLSLGQLQQKQREVVWQLRLDASL